MISPEPGGTVTAVCCTLFIEELVGASAVVLTKDGRCLCCELKISDHSRKPPSTTPNPTTLTLEQLVQQALGEQSVDMSILEDMSFYYASKIASILLMQDAKTALRYYRLAYDRPSSATCKRIAEKTGIHFSRTTSTLSGNIFEASKHSVLMVVKKINDLEEMDRLHEIEKDTRLHHPSIIDIQILERTSESMLIAMVRTNGTVANLPFPVDPLGLSKIVDTVLSALSHLDACGYHHMDVKGENIGLDHCGRAILIDLGSMAKTDVFTYVTERNVPKDLHHTAIQGKMQSRKEVDIWMLAVTVFYMLRGGVKLSSVPNRVDCSNFLSHFPDTNPGAEAALAPLLAALKKL